MIKLIVGAAEVLVFLLIVVASAYLLYVGVRLWDRMRARRMIRRVIQSKDTKDLL